MSRARTIYRYPLPVDDATAVTMPEGAQVLHIGIAPSGRQGEGELSVWALVDPDKPLTQRHYRVAGTGHPMPDDVTAMQWRATVLDGPFVWHVFEVGGTP